MTVVSVDKNAEDLTLTFVAEFDANPERVWEVWADPRQLERWWGPPTWPATFVRHELRPGARTHYFMTGPDGTKGHGWWEVTDVEAPVRLEFDDGFADEDGNPVDPTDSAHVVVTIEDAGGKTRMTTVNNFRNAEQLERMLAMGMEEGMRLAMGQIDGILAGA